MTFSTKEFAEDLLSSRIDVSDLIEDVEFLKEVDQSIILLSDDEDSIWSDVLVARKRKELMDKISTILNKVDEDNVSSVQRISRFKHK
ncbi:hypothetical protein D3C87_82610 [compost metagenome]